MTLDVRTYIVMIVLSATCSSLNTDILVEIGIMTAITLLQLISAKGSFMPKLLICYALMLLTQFVLFPVMPQTAVSLLSLPVVNIRSFFPIIIAEHRLYYLEGIADTVLYIAGGEIRKRYDAVDFFSMTDDERKELGLRKLHKNDIKITTELPLHTEKPVLTMYGITLAYKKHIVQNDLGFEAYPGEIIGIVGSNGAGKTTLLRALAGLCKPKKGVIKYNGKALSARQLRRLCELVMQDVNYQLFSDSVRNEIQLENSGMDEQTLSSILCETGLSGLEERHPQSLSGGQKQRLAIAASYASGRKILLLDEPTCGLDHRSMLLVGKLLKKLSEKGVISIVVTHDAEFIESVCGRKFALEKNNR